jgi:hypothetical protein
MLRQHSIKSIKICECDKTAILKELDRLNINEKTIYGDIDHVAAYIRAKHRKSIAHAQGKLTDYDGKVMSGEEVMQLIREIGDKNIQIFGLGDTEDSTS